MKTAVPEQPRLPGAPQAAADGSVRLPGPLKVLLADESPIVGQRLLAILASAHPLIRVEAVPVGRSVLQCLTAMEPDLVVVDLEQRSTDGFTLIAQLKSLRPACVVMVLSTYGYDEFRERALRLGADHFFNKAMEFEQLAGVVGALARVRAISAPPVSHPSSAPHPAAFQPAST